MGWVIKISPIPFKGKTSLLTFSPPYVVSRVNNLIIVVLYNPVRE